MVSVADFPRYEAYKDSEAHWLGDVPESWVLSRLGSCFSERRTKVSDVDYPPLSVTRNGIMPQLANAAKTQDGDNRKLVKKGDFVINSRSDRKGSSGVSDLDGSVSLINIVLEPKAIHTGFCHHLLKSYIFVEEYYRVGRGIVADLWTTRYDEMRTITLALPSLQEQELIAKFLDQKTAQIDQAIAIKEQQIELLQERKQIIIQQAVTQGLNPNVPMKDSGVEWIGQIPERWQVVPITKFCKSIVDYRGKTPEKVEKGVLLVTAKNIRKGYIDYEASREYIKKSNYETVMARGKPKCGDVLFTTEAPLGNTAVVDNEDIALAQRVIKFRLKSQFLPEFLNLYMCSSGFQGGLITIGTGSTVIGIKASKLNQLLAVMPPKSEQVQVYNYIRTKLKDVNSAVNINLKQIHSLNEYKTTLINSAVTGKIKITPEMLEA